MIDNLNTGNYSAEEMIQRDNFISTVKTNVLKRLADITDKIENETPFPHGNLDLDTLCEIDDRLDRILNAWYY